MPGEGRMTHYIVHIDVLEKKEEEEEYDDIIKAHDESELIEEPSCESELGTALQDICESAEDFQHLETSHSFRFSTNKPIIEDKLNGKKGTAIIIRAAHLKSGELNCTAWEYCAGSNNRKEWISLWNF